MKQALVPKYLYAGNINYVNNKIKTEYENTEIELSQRSRQLSTCSANRLCQDGKFGRGLHKNIIARMWKALTRKDEAMIRKKEVFE
jgi:hypothetical protein